MTPAAGLQMILRRAGAADASAIAELFLASRRDALPYLRDAHTDAEVREWVPTVMMKRTEVWVAEIGGTMVGFLSVAGDHVDHLYLLPGFYGRGIGSLLLDKAKELSPRRLRLFTFQRNTRARTFYEARGFMAIEFTDGSQNEEREPDVLYEWRGVGA
ncbi:MAG TPA: GNAT family N-acetyltransferase [bacterium]|nr:GNAT family N-acetyltransferase [bacterium]